MVRDWKIMKLIKNENELRDCLFDSGFWYDDVDGDVSEYPFFLMTSHMEDIISKPFFVLDSGSLIEMLTVLENHTVDMQDSRGNT